MAGISAPELEFAADEDLARLDHRFEGEPAAEIVGWAVESFHPYLSLCSSMADAVLIDVALRVEPSIEVVFIDTGCHFPETIATMEVVRRRYGLNLRVMTAPPQCEDVWRVDPDNCCSALKVGLLSRALQGKLAWMSGLRRADSPLRANAPIVSRDRRGLIKLNPIASWTDHDVARYIRDHDVPVNPLLDQGYRSIGCWPCTRPVDDSEHPRAGRWQSREKTECGLHM